jgi:cytochrome c556
VLTACLEPLKDTHPQQVLTKRKALFKQFTRTLEPMAMVANERSAYQHDAFLVYAQDLGKIASKPWSYFPEDGNYPPTHSRPAVWSQPAEFKSAQEHFQAAVRHLVQAAEGTDLPAIRAAVYDVSNSCKACHKQFRFD